MPNESCQSPIKALVLVQMPKKLDYFIGSKMLDLSGGQICVIHEDGTFETCSMDNKTMPVTFQSEQEGPTIATLSYMGKKLLFQIHIRKPEIRKFIVTKAPEKKEYLAGEKIDLTGLQLEAEYETGDRVPWKDIPVVEHRVKQGEAVYPLQIGTITVPIYIKVSAAKLVGIRMGKLPNKTEYLERNEDFSVTGATIIKMFDSGNEEESPLPAAAVRGFSNLNPGQQTLTVQIGPYTTTFNIVIRAKKPTKLIVVSEPFKESYIEGQSIDMDGLRLSVEYDNGETRIAEEYEYKPKEASLKDPAIHIWVGDVETDIPIGVMPRQLTAISIAQLPKKLQYLERKEPLDISGAELKLQYNYGNPTTIPITPEMVHGFDNKIVGECTVEVQYMGFITTFQVEIIPAQLLGILIRQMPDKTDYAPGEIFDKTGMSVYGFYNNGLLQPINSYTVSPSGPLKEQDIAVIVICMDKSAVIPIRVAEMFRTQSIRANGDNSDEQSEDVPMPLTSDVLEKEKVEEKPEVKQKEGLFSRLFYPPSSKLRDLHDER